MARIILGALINDIRNAIGALVFSSWKGINYVRDKAITVANPNSDSQAAIRARLSDLSKRWYNTLTDAQRAVWEEYALQLGSAQDSNQAQEGGTKVVIPQNRGVMSGFNAYVMANALGFSAGIFPLGFHVDNAPLGVDPPNAPTNLACECRSISGNGNVLSLTWNKPIEPPTLGIGRYRIWLLSLDAGVHRQIVLNLASANEATVVVLVNIAQGQQSDIRFLPGHYHIQIDFINPNGQKSPPSNVCQTKLEPVTEPCLVIPP
ncbi:MAG: DUF6266 family protein [Candidatus Bathyarchaeota archaeon]|nr:DUF6266 family protein [Candidatus Bathyarchaeota archaeon]